MIQIIAGTFGYYNGRKVIPITKEDGLQQFDPDLEARLVKEGVAKYVDAAPAQAEDPNTPDPAGANAPQDPIQPKEGTEPPADGLPEYNEGIKLDELKEIAASYGVDASAMRKKADVIAAIEAAKTDQPDDDGTDDEEPPQLGAADPV